jgi:hypothetical protein
LRRTKYPAQLSLENLNINKEKRYEKPFHTNFKREENRTKSLNQRRGYGVRGNRRHSYVAGRQLGADCRRLRDQSHLYRRLVGEPERRVRIWCLELRFDY